MAVFAIADPHLSLGCDKPMDIFSGWKDYVGRLERNWRAVVDDNDTVVIAGDISWAMKLEETKEDFAFLNNLPGRKLLLKGNHDYWWSTRKKIEDFLSANGFHTMGIIFNSAVALDTISVCGSRGWFYDAESDADKKVLNREVGRLQTSIAMAETSGLEPVVFLHYPPVYGDEVCEEILSVLKEPKIRRCYCGPTHGAACKKAVTGLFEGIDFQLISCDYTGFRPILVR